MRQPPPLVAHRGNALEFPENTLPAFESALQLGARYFELDVQLSRDGIPMVSHDPTLQRTAGRPGSIWDHDAADLQAISAGESARFGTRFESVCYPTLRQALELRRRWPATTLFVEIKTESLEQFGHAGVLDAVNECLRDDTAHCVVISFDYEAVRLARQTSRVRIGWVLTKYDAAAEQMTRALNPEFLFCNWNKLPPEPIWPGSWRWCCYEVREAKRAHALLDRGVSLIETMAVRDMCAVLADRPTTP
jgi:glycerophosphoryl diester phosphodiesterase